MKVIKAYPKNPRPLQEVEKHIINTLQEVAGSI
jgi:hypothetical protein